MDHASWSELRSLPRLRDAAAGSGPASGWAPSARRSSGGRGPSRRRWRGSSRSWPTRRCDSWPRPRPSTSWSAGWPTSVRRCRASTPRRARDPRRRGTPLPGDRGHRPAVPPADACQCYVLDGDRLRLRAAEGPAPERPEIAPDDGLVGLAVRLGRPVSVRDYTTIGSLEDLQGAELLMAAPLQEPRAPCSAASRSPSSLPPAHPGVARSPRPRRGLGGADLENARTHEQTLARTIEDELVRAYTYAYYQRRSTRRRCGPIATAAHSRWWSSASTASARWRRSVAPTWGACCRSCSRAPCATSTSCAATPPRTPSRSSCPRPPPARAEVVVDRLSSEIRNFHFAPYADERAGSRVLRPRARGARAARRSDLLIPRPGRGSRRLVALRWLAAPSWWPLALVAHAAAAWLAGRGSRSRRRDERLLVVALVLSLPVLGLVGLGAIRVWRARPALRPLRGGPLGDGGPARPRAGAGAGRPRLRVAAGAGLGAAGGRPDPRRRPAHAAMGHRAPGQARRRPRGGAAARGAAGDRPRHPDRGLRRAPASGGAAGAANRPGAGAAASGP